MKSQAVSVGQKLIERNVATGGYQDALGTPSASLLNEIESIDSAIGSMVSKLRKQNLLESTLVVITAKHGQSPIDPKRFLAVPGSSTNLVSPATLLEDLLPASESPANSSGIGPTEDDISLLWLADSPNTGIGVAKARGQ
jgi:arylsulfatase A-like enzyme